MTANIEMTSSFLANSRTTSYSSNKRSMTITWDCTPGRVYYNYVIPGGSTQRKGYYAHNGIYRYESGSYSGPKVRRGMFEGVKCVKIQTRKNGGSWTTSSSSTGLTSLTKSFTSSKNGDVYEIKCTYQVWTMGSPFRTVPFMWFGDNYGNYNEGKNKFSQSSPASPGRTWSGIRNYTKSGNAGTDQNESWSTVNYSWYQPNSTSKTTNWTYLHAKEYYEEGKTKSNGWLSTYACEKWLSGMPYGTDAGWTGNVTGVSPQKTRKSSWWTYERTFTNTYTVSGIDESPEALSTPTCSLKVVDNLSVADSNGRYNGIAGKVQLTYKQSQGTAGTYKLWAYQQSGTSALVSSGNISNNETKSITVNFTNYSFSRSKNIAYYAEVSVYDSNYSKTLTGKSASSTSWTSLISSGTHYYNDEPPASSSFSVTKSGTEKFNLSWNSCTDPDGHSVSYKIYVCRTATSSSSGSVTLKVKGGSGHTQKTISYSDVYSTSSTSYSLSTSKYNDGETLYIYLVPTDAYYNDYYYANSNYEMAGANSTVALEVIDNMTVKDSSGKLNGDHGTIKYTYTHKDKLDAKTINIYAYVADNTGTSKGSYACTVHSVSNVKSGASGTVVLNFNECKGFTRGRKIKYFAVATDTAGDTSYYPYSYDSANMWSEATGYHYFNSVPTAVTPFITEDKETAYDDDIVELAWSKATDAEGHEIHYRLYIQAEGDTPNKGTFYFNDLSKPQEVAYTKYVDLGATTLPTTNNPYMLDISKYIGRDVNVWIMTYDKYNSEKYLSGSILNLRSPGIAPDIPTINVEYAYARDLYGDDKVDGENGYISVSYSHPVGRPGSVYVHAICKKIGSNEKATFKNIAEFQMTSGTWSSDIKINFPKIFGEEWRSSEIRYYATAETIKGESTVGASWVPNVNMWDDWTGTHKFNAQPGDITAELDHNLGNLHDNAYVKWTKASDPDDKTIDPMYAIVLVVKSDIRETLAFVQGVDGSTVNKMIGYTEMWDTVNSAADIDLSPWEDEEEFTIYIIPHDDYANSYYHMSDPITFKKIKYGKPVLDIDLHQDHSEYGDITITYNHEDLTWDAEQNKFISNDPEHRLPENGDFDGAVSIYCYFDETYSYNYALEDIDFKPGETKTFTIEFDKVCPYSRSHEIRYYVLATDKLTGVQNYDAEYDEASTEELTDWSHYYNDEPDDPQPYIGSLIIEEDKYIYDFMYTDIVWDRPYEPDGHDMIYYVYINTPAHLKEKVLSTTINRKTNTGDIEPVFVEYTRKYRVLETYDEETETYGSLVQYYKGRVNGIEEWSENLYEEYDCELPFTGIRIQYELDHLGKEWEENEEYTVYVEARDNRGFENSYYGISEPFTYARRKHEPPNEVILNINYNLADDTGDGERGTMSVIYTHPEGDIDGTVTIYAYQDDELIADIYTGTFKNNVMQTIEYRFPDFTDLKRSKEINYYAVAKDNLVGFSSLDKFLAPKNEGEEALPNEVKLQHIPYLTPDADGNYGYWMINIDGVSYSEYLQDDEYIGPVRKGFHYYNEEPPSTTPVIYDDGNISYKSAKITWPHVEDPDGHDVSYEIYVAGTDMDEHMNTLLGTFYNDEIPEPDDVLIEEEAEVEGVRNTSTDGVIITSKELMYHKAVTIPASLAFDASQLFSLSTEEYSEDTTINIWIVSKDQYVNSYYRSGEILSINKGHQARPIREVYPRNGSTVYAQCPRILIYLGEDNQIQTTYVGWKGEEYNNKDHPEMFSDVPNTNNVIVFKPPTPYTDLNGTKVTFYVYAHNQCSFTDRKYVTYTYRDFFNNFADEKLIAIKSDHINTFRKAIDVTRDAYGILTAKYTRDIKKNMIFENFDFNETKEAICAVNDLLNGADPSVDLDHVNPLIVNLADLDVVDYEGIIGTNSYNEFLEWARLVYILENL